MGMGSCLDLFDDWSFGFEMESRLDEIKFHLIAVWLSKVNKRTSYRTVQIKLIFLLDKMNCLKAIKLSKSSLRHGQFEPEVVYLLYLLDL